MFGFNMNLFDPMRIFDNVQHAFDNDFGFDSPIFNFPPMPIDPMPSFDPMWPFHFPNRKFHEPNRHGDNRFENDAPWRVPDDNNGIPDADNNNPTTKVNGNRIYLKNFHDVSFVLLHVLKFLHVFNENIFS